MSTKKLREVEKVPDQEIAGAKLRKADHDAGRHGIPLPKCDDCRAMPDYQSRYDASARPREAIEAELPSGRKVLTTTPTELSAPVHPRLAKLSRAPMGRGRRTIADIITPIPPVETPSGAPYVSPKRSKKAPVPRVVEQPDDFDPLAPKPGDPGEADYIEPIDVDAPADADHEVAKTAARDGLPFTPTREEWLLRAIDALRPDFEAIEAKLPSDIRVSIGWMGGRGKKVGVIGQCWMPEAVEDQQPAIFLIPTLKEPVDILAVLVHELVHASGQRQHRAGAFGKVAGKVGLVGPWTGTSPSEPLKAKLAVLAEKLGPFPHSKITAGTLTGKAGPRIQSTRMLKLVCPDCGYTVRTTRKWLDIATPGCTNGHGVTILMEEVSK